MRNLTKYKGDLGDKNIIDESLIVAAIYIQYKNGYHPLAYL